MLDLLSLALEKDLLSQNQAKRQKVNKYTRKAEGKRLNLGK